jgi:membrane associated rhomboid family serine protease
MLEDRDYMRQPAYDDGPAFSHLFRWPRWSWTLALVLVLVNVAVFLVECAVSSHPLGLKPNNDFINQYFALSRDGMSHGYVWQLLTYQFMHASFFHILFNCWAIYVFGRVIEEMLGVRHFLIIMLSSGVVGGLVQVGTAFLWPQFDGPVVGASAGAFGLVAAFATLFPERELMILVFFVIPLRMRAKNLLIFSAGLALAGIVFPKFFNLILGGNVANAAHLGGMATGLMYVLVIIQGRLIRPPESDSPAPPRADAPAATPSFWHSKPGKSPSVELSAEELLKTQVDPILDKISAHGLQSLSAREREILEKASGKMAKR